MANTTLPLIRARFFAHVECLRPDLVPPISARPTPDAMRALLDWPDFVHVLAAFTNAVLSVFTSVKDIEALKGDFEGIIVERKSRFKRFFSAKRHREELKDVVEQLETARSNYTTALATLNAMTIAQVNSDVRAIALVLDARPIYIPGTRCAQDVTLLSGANRFEEI
ncbi:unnamed protein product [Peniophora sp. CBMAI 1063]|nr:unnamed protein product [Peniophora sp. CBMAI 1063]